MQRFKTLARAVSAVTPFFLGAFIFANVAGAVGTAFPAGSLLQPNDVTSSHIRENTIVNGDIAPGAAIDIMKITGTTTAGLLYMSNGTKIATSSKVRISTSTPDFYLFGGRIHASTTNFGGFDQTWPSTDGEAGEALSTDGSGGLSWVTPGGPTGSIILFASSTAPSGWFITNGSSYDRDTYPNLGILLSDRWGTTTGQTLTADTGTEVITATSDVDFLSIAIPSTPNGWAYTTTGGPFNDDGVVSSKRRISYTSDGNSGTARVTYLLTGLTAGKNYVISATIRNTRNGSAFGSALELYINDDQAATNADFSQNITLSTTTLATSTSMNVSFRISNGAFGGGVSNTHDISNFDVDIDGHALVDGDRVTVSNAGGALPTPLAANTTYYIKSPTATTFQLSLTSGGAAIDISGAGSGTNYFHNSFKIPNLGSTSTPALYYIIKQ